MPRKRDGQHDIHIRVPEHDFRLLQAYCANGVERITATSIITTFLAHYIADYIKPRLAKGEQANYNALSNDIPSATALVAKRK